MGRLLTVPPQYNAYRETAALTIAEGIVTEYDKLEDQWAPLLRKFASWRIPGMAYDDVMQEMRIVLFNAGRSYRPGGNAKFSTFLYTACLNTALKLLYKAGGGLRPRKSTVPQALIDPLCGGDHGDDVACQWCATQHGVLATDDLSMINLLSDATLETRAVADLILAGKTSRRSWADSGLTKGQIHDGATELKTLLREGG